MSKKTLKIGKTNLFLLPSLVGLFMILILPSLKSLKLAFTFESSNKSTFSLDNIITVWSNDAFQRALHNTIQFFLIGFIGMTVMSIVFSMVLYHTKINSILLTVFLIPTVVPTASITQIWMLIFKNTIFAAFYEANINMDFWIILLLFMWKYGGIMILVIYHRLSKIPKTYYEMAEIEGANFMQKFVNITMSELRPAILFNGLLFSIFAFKVYREIFLMFGYYPSKSIYMIQHYMNNLFRTLDFTKLSAMSVIFLVIIMLWIICILLFNRRYFDDTNVS